MKTIAIAVFALAVPLSAVASAQPVSATAGFPIGEKSRIHTSLEVGVGYDSNRDRFDNDNAPEDGQLSDWRAIIRPGIEVEVPGTTFQLQLRSLLTITQFFGTGVISSDTTYGGSVGATMQIGSDQSAVSFKLANELLRTPTLFDESGTIASDERRFRQWFNNGSARLTFRPGGRALEIDVGYQNQLTLYDSDDARLPQGQQHGGLFEARWRFLPKTVLLFHADVSRFFTSNDPEGSIETTSNAIPINVYVGAIGQVTSKLQAELTAGYGDTFSEASGRSTRGPIGSAIIRYDLADTLSVRGGYRRTIAPVVALSSYSADVALLGLQSTIFGRLLFSLYGQYEFRQFAALPGVAGLDDGSTAQVIIGDARVEYWFFEWLRANLNYRVIAQLTEDEDRVANVSVGAPGIQRFNRQQVFINIGLRY